MGSTQTGYHTSGGTDSGMTGTGTGTGMTDSGEHVYSALCIFCCAPLGLYLINDTDSVLYLRIWYMSCTQLQ